MDLLATVRKEGSRGGRGDFKWSEVQASSHRENYLGHSLMAPVGRWQKGRDLNWYARNDTTEEGAESLQEQAAKERKEEISRIKEAEQDALARALGLPVAPRANPNMEALGNKREVDKMLKESAQDEEGGGGQGVGFGGVLDNHPDQKTRAGQKERIEGTAETQDRELQYALKEYQRRHRYDDDDKRRDRRRSRSKDRQRSHRKHRERDGEHHNRDRLRSRDRHRRRRSGSRERQHRAHRPERSRSPDRRRHIEDPRHHRNEHR